MHHCTGIVPCTMKIKKFLLIQSGGAAKDVYPCQNLKILSRGLARNSVHLNLGEYVFKMNMVRLLAGCPPMIRGC